MKKSFFLVVASLVLVFTVNAQTYSDKPIKFGVGAMAGLPMADANNIYNLAYAFDGQVEYHFVPAFAINLNGGYTSFTRKIGVTTNSMKLVYGLAGAKYYLTDNIYGGLQAGISVVASDGTGTTLIIAPALGIKFSRNIDLSLRYQSQTEKGYNFSFLGLRLGYTIFSLNDR